MYKNANQHIKSYYQHVMDAIVINITYKIITQILLGY